MRPCPFSGTGRGLGRRAALAGGSEARGPRGSKLPLRAGGGVVRGTWELEGDLVRVAWFREAGRVPRKTLSGEVGRLSSVLGRELGSEVALV